MSKPSKDDLLRALRNGIASGWDRKDLQSKQAYSLFELYVFKTSIEAIKEAGSIQGYGPEITYKDQDGVEVSPIRLQTGPHIPSTYGYVYAEIRFPGSRKRAIEVHCGLKYEGKSEVVHECDVSILGWTEAESRRKDNKNPRHHKILLSIECKFYSSTIELAMMRGFRGLIDDIGSSHNTQIFVTSSDIRSSGVNLIKYKKQSAIDEFVPSNRIRIDELKKIVIERITDFLA